MVISPKSIKQEYTTNGDFPIVYQIYQTKIYQKMVISVRKLLVSWKLRTSNLTLSSPATGGRGGWGSSIPSSRRDGEGGGSLP